MEYPVIGYQVELRSNRCKENMFNVTSPTAATRVSTILNLQDLNQLYQYRVIAVNIIGSVMSDESYFGGFVIINMCIQYLIITQIVIFSDIRCSGHLS